MVPPSIGSDDDEANGNFPYHPDFGETSVVRVRPPPRLRGNGPIIAPVSDAGLEPDVPPGSASSKLDGGPVVSNVAAPPPYCIR